MTTTETRQPRKPPPLYSKCICPKCGLATFALWLAHGTRKRCGQCGAVMELQGNGWVVEETDGKDAA